MRKIIIALTVFLLLFCQSSYPQRGRKSSGYHIPKNSHTSSATSSYPHKSKQTYDVGGTKYISGETYKNTGIPKVERSQTAKREYLQSRGLKKVPAGYDVDHVVPLSKGGADKPYNMQLLTKEAHKQKTANDRKTK